MASIIQINDDRCFLCQNAYGTEWHHVFGGPNRRLADADGLIIRVCRQCHEEIHEGENSAKLKKALHELGQTKYEEAGHTREEFMKRYGRNYL